MRFAVCQCLVSNLKKKQHKISPIRQFVNVCVWRAWQHFNEQITHHIYSAEKQETEKEIKRNVYSILIYEELYKILFLSFVFHSVEPNKKTKKNAHNHIRTFLCTVNSFFFPLFFECKHIRVLKRDENFVISTSKSHLDVRLCAHYKHTLSTDIFVSIIYYWFYLLTEIHRIIISF